jgi:hypothetical protein
VRREESNAEDDSMMKAVLLVAIGLAVCSIAGCVSDSVTTQPTGSIDGRDLTVTWRPDSARHVYPTYAHAEASTKNPSDYSVDVSIADPKGGIPLASMSMKGEADSDGKSRFVYVEDSLALVKPGDSVSIQAVFKDRAGAVTATRTVEFVKP